MFIDPAFFELREQFDLDDPDFLSFFYPSQQRYDVTYPRPANPEEEFFVTPHLSIGGATYTGSRIPLPNPSVIPDDGRQIASSLPFWFFTVEVAERFFPDLSDPEDLLWDPMNYPISWAFDLSFDTGPNSCRFAAEFRVLDGRGIDFNIDPRQYFKHIADDVTTLPNTV